MEEVRQDAAETTVEEGSEENGGRQDRTWFPYITKVQFERFLSRLETKIPDQVDRDYVRPIIRTPSMIHRFLRGIESMHLTDRDQKPTDLLLRLVPKETRRFAVADVIRDLYKELLPEWDQSSGNMSDDAIVDYFRNRTGMGLDSANKMKMFFKYLMAEADFGDPSEAQKEAATAEPAPQDERSETPEPASQDERSETPEPASQDERSETPEPAPQDERSETPEPAPQEERSTREPAPKARSGRDGRTKRTSPERQERPQQERQERQQERPQQERPQQERPSSQQERPLTETQRAYLDTLQSTVQIKIDGDWDEDMIRLVFDRLERLFDRLRRA